jgi:putative cell wall-binding protein
MVVASNSGSQLPHLVFTSRNIILVVGGQKITADLNSATERLENYVIPLEDVRAMGAYGAHTANNKTLIIRGENPMMKRNVTVILVGEKLGF